MNDGSPPGTETQPLRRELLDTLLEHSSEALVIVDEHGSIIYGSPGAALLTGTSTTAAVGTSIFDYLHPDDVDLSLELFERRSDYGGRDRGREIRVRHASGEWLPMLVWANLLSEPGWGSCAFTLRNVGDQPAVERSLRSHLAIAEAIGHLTASFIDTVTAEDILGQVQSALSKIALLTRSQAVSVWLEREKQGEMEQVAQWPGDTATGAVGVGAKAGSNQTEPVIDDLLSRSWAVQDADGNIGPLNHLAWVDGATAFLSEPFSAGRRRGVVILARSLRGPDWLSDDALLTRSFAKLLGRVLRSAHSEALLAQIYRDGPHGVTIRDGNGSLVECNSQYLEMFGLTREQAHSRSLDDVVHPDDLPGLMHELGELHAGRIDRLVHESRVALPDGSQGWLRANVVLLEEAWGSDSFTLTTLEDVSETHQQRQDLDTERQRLERLVDNVPAVILRVTRDSTVLLCGPEIERVSEITVEQLIGARIFDFLTDADEREAWTRGLGRVFDEGATITKELHLPTGETEFVLDARVVPELEPDGTIKTALIVAMDITERRDIADQLRHAATHDSLTGLANRQAMLDRIDELRSRNNVSPSLVMIDLDRFKLVNDSVGHAGGDEVLRIAAERIENEVRRVDMVARLGGDEFALVVPDIEPADLERMAERLRTSIEGPFLVADHLVPQTISLGVAIGEAGLDAADLLVRADRALYAAKAKGRNRCVIFDDSLLDDVETRVVMERELRHAIDHDELEVYFQPEFSLEDRSIVGAEALLRWRHPEYGLVAADQFIDVAEASGLIVEMGRIALRTACFQFAQICTITKRHDLTLRINISAREFARTELPELVGAALSLSGFPPEQLCLEMTETTLMDSPEIALDTFGRLHELGVEFAIDDFGTGYSSLTYLKRFPVDALKIDRSFVEDITTNAESRAIVDSIVGLANALDLEVVAEGIETEDQAELIRSLGCGRGQGHLVSAAIAPSEFVRLCAPAPRYAQWGTNEVSLLN